MIPASAIPSKKNILSSAVPLATKRIQNRTVATWAWAELMWKVFLSLFVLGCYYLVPVMYSMVTYHKLWQSFRRNVLAGNAGAFSGLLNRSSSWSRKNPDGLVHCTLLRAVVERSSSGGRCMEEADGRYCIAYCSTRSRRPFLLQ
jgi:hypothetical protein